jgi:hypothetical protein
MKTLDQIHRELGFERGNHYHDNTAYPGGYGYTDAAVLELGVYLDLIKDKETRDYLRGRIAGAKARQKDAAEREKAKKEQQERDARYKATREAEIQRKETDNLKAIIRRANPLATESEVEALLPKLKERLMLERSVDIATGNAGTSDYARRFLNDD